MKKFKVKIHPVTQHSQGLFADTVMTLDADEKEKGIAAAKALIGVLKVRYGRLTYSIEEV